MRQEKIEAEIRNIIKKEKMSSFTSDQIYFIAETSLKGIKEIERKIREVLKAGVRAGDVIEFYHKGKIAFVIKIVKEKQK
ncbi:MAG: hypothetical protein LRZ94_00930 [Candidatus Pacebacteria bacterium]|nr:hypothetical protein [Candidatus Paceibacterota bacterium]